MCLTGEVGGGITPADSRQPLQPVVKVTVCVWDTNGLSCALFGRLSQVA